MRNPLLATVMMICFSSCIEDDSPSPFGVELRVKNVSNVHFDELVVQPRNGGKRVFKDLEAGEFSDYASFDFCYRYAFIQAIVGADTLYLLPIDYAGETRYTTGKYTYEIGIFENRVENGSITLTFNIDG